MKAAKIFGYVGIVAGITGSASAELVMNNGEVNGSANYMEVTLGDQGGGYADALNIYDPNTLAMTDVLYDTGFVYRNGDTGDFSFMSSSAPTLQGDGSALSTGTFVGPNGDISFSISTTINGRRLSHTLSLSSAQAFGNVTVANYLDQDVYGYGDDVAVIKGTGTSSEIFTFDDETDVGISHSIDWTNSENLSFLGWSVYSYDTSVSSGGGVGNQAFTQDGTVTLVSWPDYAYADGNPAYGPDDVVSAFAFKLDEAATSASVSAGNSGIVSGVPEPSTLASMAAVTLVGLFVRRVFCMQ